MFGKKADPMVVEDSDSLSCLSEDELKKRLHKAARAELSEQLLGDECAVIAIEGVSSSAMIVTNRDRVLVFKKGVLSGVAFGRKMYSWHFSEIEEVRVDVRLMNGFVALETDKLSADGLSYWGSEDSDTWKAANAIPVDKSLEKQAREGAAKLRKMLHHYHNPQVALNIVSRVPEPAPAPPNQVQEAPTASAAEQVAPAPPNRFCFACGTQLHPQAMFCGACGQKVV